MRMSLAQEIGAYEAMWLEPETTFKTLAKRFASKPAHPPSSFISPESAQKCAIETFATLKAANVDEFGVQLNRFEAYPPSLRDAQRPVELLYFQGAWELTKTRCVSIIGSRNASSNGCLRAVRLVKALVDAGFTIVSGLARGIDHAAHEAAIKCGGRTIAVLGTPIGVFYPSSHRRLQNHIASHFLVISQVPILRYARQTVQENRLFFPERNATMSALTEATIIVEASEMSGTLRQASAALYQGRKLFILDSCFQRTDATWPRKYEAHGAIRVRTLEDIWAALEKQA